MNKQEIEKAIETLESEEKRQYDFLDALPPKSRDKAIEIVNMIKACEFAISALQQQLDDRWIPVSPETNPKENDIYLVTFEENGKVYVERFYYSAIIGWMMPVHWQDEGHIDKLVRWRDMPEPWRGERS